MRRWLNVAVAFAGALGGVVAAAQNAPADFSVYPLVLNPNPVPYGFNISPPDGNAAGVQNNHFGGAGGMTPWDARLPLTATTDGTDTTFISLDYPGTDFWRSINSGFFVGALSRVYRFQDNAWTLLRTDTITGYTAVAGSSNPADHTITFASSGPATMAGDVIWISKDANAQPPNYNLINPSHSFYALLWNTEKQTSVNSTFPNPQYSYDTDVPAGANIYNGPGVGALSLKLTDNNKETNGIDRYMQGIMQTNATYGIADDGLEPGHTYEVSLWAKQVGVANGSMNFLIQPLGISHTFTGVTNAWQKFTWTFGYYPNGTQPVPSEHFDFLAPGTMWFDNIRIFDITNGAQPDNWDPRQLAALQGFLPGTIRIWSNFSSTSGGYNFWSLDSWIADEEHSRANFQIGSQVETDETLNHLPTALAYARQVGANPWLIVSMSLSEMEWSELIDYLCAPAGQGYAQYRPANHPGPYTADFSTIYVEFGNEEWGTQSTPVNGDYGQWVHHMLSQAIAGKSYFDPAKIQFVANGWFKNPGFGSTAAAQAPEVSVVDSTNYVSGNNTLTGDAYYQSDLLQLPETNKAYIDATVAQQQEDAYKGHPYQLAVYEGGPGTDTPAHTGDTSLAIGVATLDAYLYASQQGFGPENYFGYGINAGDISNGVETPAPYTSHSTFAKGLVPHPAWEALEMRNLFAHGPMVWVGANQDPASSADGVSPVIGVYAFEDTSSGSNVAEVFVISRDLNNTTPVTLHFPGIPTGSAALYTLTGNPRANNDTSLLIPIASSSVNVTQNYTFTMPPGSVYLFVVPTGTWSATLPAPSTPGGLAANPGASEVSLSWAPENGASSYNVKRSLTAGGPYTTIASAKYSFYKDTDVINGTTYYYVVTALNSGGESANSNEVPAEPNVAVAQYTSTPPPIDGSSSAVWDSAPTYTYQHVNLGNTPDTGSFKLLWDSNNLYVLATIMDSTPYQSTSIWNGDSVEVYIDGNDSKPTTYGANDFQYAFPWNGTTITESKHNATQGVQFGQINVPGGYQMTVALPWSTLQVTSPKAGDYIGFDTMVNDADPANTLLGKIAWWATANNSWNNPSLFGNAVLEGSDTPPPDISTVAGTGAAGYTGDGGPATSAQLHMPQSVTEDSVGNTYFADELNNAVRVVAANTGTLFGQSVTAGNIYTIACIETPSDPSQSKTPHGDDCREERRRARSEEFAGTEAAASKQAPEANGNEHGGDDSAGKGEGMLFSESHLSTALAVDSAGDLYITDARRDLIRMVAARTETIFGQSVNEGATYVVAGGGSEEIDSIPATSVRLGNPHGLAVDRVGNLYISDSDSNELLVVAASKETLFGQNMTAGDIYIIAGDGKACRRSTDLCGDGGYATSAEFHRPYGLALDGVGNIYVADSGDSRIRMVAAASGVHFGQSVAAGNVYTVAGNGMTCLSRTASCGDGGSSISAELTDPTAVALDFAGNLFITDSGDYRVRMVAAATESVLGQSEADGNIYTVAGNGKVSPLGDGGLATGAGLNLPDGVSVSTEGLYIADTFSNRIRLVTW